MKYQWIFIVTLIMGNPVFAGENYQGHVYSGLYGHGVLGPNTGSTGYTPPGGSINGYSPNNLASTRSSNSVSACGTCGAVIPIIHYFPVAPYDPPKQDQKIYKY